jgi:hypothetical protein
MQKEFLIIHAKRFKAQICPFQEKTLQTHNVTMGIEIADYHQEPQDTASVQVAALLRETKKMNSEELKAYFEKLFSRMNPQAKEALTEILWVGLNPSEQQQFQMPYFGSR